MVIESGQKMYASDILNLTFFPKGTILTFSSTAWGATSPEFKNIWKVCNAANHAADPNNIPDLTNRFLRGADSSGSTGGADNQDITIMIANLPAHNHTVTKLPLSGTVSGLKATSSSSAHEHTLSGGTASDGAHGHGDNLTVGNNTHGHSLRGGAWGSGSCDGLTTSYQIAGRNAVYGSDNYYTNSPNGTAFISANTHGHTLSGGVTSTNSAHRHDFSSGSKAASGGTHEHDVSGSITGGSVSGSTENTGSGSVISVDTVPSYYAVIYIIKIV
jgi:hypothetical protein